MIPNEETQSAPPSLKEEKEEILGKVTSSTPRLPTVEYIPRILASKIGIVEARLLHFIAHKVNRSRNIKDGTKYWYGSVEQEFAPRFPYWKPARMAAALRRLEKLGLLERKSGFNKLKADRTYWYTVSDSVRRQVNEELICYNLEDAVNHGVESALIIYSLLYHIEQSSEPGLDSNCCHFSPIELSRYLPLSVSTIKRHLKTLERVGIIKKLANQKSVYGLNDRWQERLAKLPESQKRMKNSGPSTGQASLDQDSPVKWLTSAEVKHWKDTQVARINQWLKDNPGGSAHTHSVEIAQTNLNKLSDAAFCRLMFCAGHMDALIPRIEELFSEWPFKELQNLPLVKEAVVELLMGSSSQSFAWFFSLGTFSYWCTKLFQREREAGERQAERNLQERVRRFASPLAAFEGDTVATPDRKTEIVLAGIRSLNGVGIKDLEGQYRDGVFIITREDERQLKAFFTDNTEYTPGMILDLLHTCGGIALYSAEGDFDPQFHARRSNEVGFMVRHLPSVIREVGSGQTYIDALNPEWVDRIEREREKRREKRGAER